MRNSSNHKENLRSAFFTQRMGDAKTKKIFIVRKTGETTLFI